MFKDKRVLLLRSATAIGAALVSVPAMAADSESVTAAKAAITSGYADTTTIVLAGIAAACALSAIVFAGLWVRSLLAGRSPR